MPPALAGLLAAMLLIAPPAQADVENDSLPGGTSISVSIDSPADAASVSTANGDVPLSGTASVGSSPAVGNATLIYVLDTSASSEATDGCGGNQNPTQDSESNTILDCEIAAARALNQDAIATTVAPVGAVFFNDGAAVQDVSAAAGTQTLVGPAHDDANSNNGIPDVEDRLGTAASGGQTNFEAAVQSACGLAALPSNPNPTNTIIVLMSDGFATAGGNAVDDATACASVARIETFAIGGVGSCHGGAIQGSLQQIAEATGGTCTRVGDASTLPAVLPGAIRFDPLLTDLDLSIDGGALIGMSSTATPGLPLAGPASVTYGVTLGNFDPGAHTLCVKATGTDDDAPGGGFGSVQDCHSFTVVPAAPTGLSTSPASPANELQPRVRGDVLNNPAVTVNLYDNATCTGTAIASGPSADFNGAGIQVTVADGSTTTFGATAVANGTETACSAPVSYTELLPPQPGGPGPGPDESDQDERCDGKRVTLSGTDGDDVLRGTRGDDVIVAGDGDDRVIGDAGDDIICGNSGDDKFYGGSGDDFLAGHKGSDTLEGGPGSDTLKGGKGPDDLAGNSGRDDLRGGSGKGDDDCSGGSGRDATNEGCD